jgi:hypothetical protein
MAEEELFRVIVDEEIGQLETLERIDVSRIGHKIWRWIKSGTNRILNLSSQELAVAADTVRQKIQSKLGGEWEVSQISLTFSTNPSATIVIARKTRSQ